MTVMKIVIATLILALLANVGSWRSTYINCSRINVSHGYIQDILATQLRRMEAGESDGLFKQLYGERWEDFKKRSIVETRENINRFRPVRCIFPWSQT